MATTGTPSHPTARSCGRLLRDLAGDDVRRLDGCPDVVHANHARTGGPGPGGGRQRPLEPVGDGVPLSASVGADQPVHTTTLAARAAETREPGGHANLKRRHPPAVVA